MKRTNGLKCSSCCTTNGRVEILVLRSWIIVQNACNVLCAPQSDFKLIFISAFFRSV